MKRQFFTSLIAAALIITAVSCSANGASTTIVLTAPHSSAYARTDNTTTDNSPYYFIVKMSGGNYTNTQTGSFSANTSGASVTFDGLPAGQKYTVAVELRTIGDDNVVDAVYEGSNSLIVSSYNNSVSVPLRDGFTYIDPSTSCTSSDGTSTNPYKTIAAAVAAKESSGIEPFTYNFYKLESSETISSDSDAVAPSYNTYLTMNNSTLTWSNTSATKPLFAPKASLVLARGTITGPISLSSYITTTLTRLLNSYSYSQPVIATNSTLVLSSCTIANFCYTGDEAIVYATSDGASSPAVFMASTYITYDLATSASSKGIVFIDNGVCSLTDTYLYYCYGTVNSGFSTKDTAVYCYDSSIFGLLSLSTSSGAPLTVDGGSVKLCGAWVAAVTGEYTCAAEVTGGAPLTMADSISMQQFNGKTLAAEETSLTAATKSSPTTAIVSGTYVKSDTTITWTTVFTNSLVLGKAKTDNAAAETATLAISGTSRILGYTYLNSGCTITQTGTLTTSPAAVIIFDASGSPSSVAVFTASNSLDTSKFTLAQDGYTLSGTNAILK